MRESDTWKIVRNNLHLFGRLGRIEDLLKVGVPDVHYTLRRSPIMVAVSGWLELKHIDELPQRPKTPVVVRHLTLDQVNWLNAEHDAGGKAWLLLHVGVGDGLDRFMMLTAPQTRVLYDRKYNTAQLLADTWSPTDPVDGFPLRRVLTCLTR